MPLSFAEIDAWQRLTGRRLEIFEVPWLRAVDDAWLAGGLPDTEA